MKKIFLLASIVCSLNSFAQIIAGGQYHSLAICSDNTVKAWGKNNYGQLGNGTTTNSNAPVQVSSLTGITAIAAGGKDHSLALKNNGTVWAWGYNNQGQLGNGTATNSNVPVQVSSLTGITAIAAGGFYYSLALKSDGTAWAWGNNQYGQLGNGTNTASNIPVQISNLTGIIAIAVGNYHSIALKNDGTVWAWGNNNFGQIGVSNFSNVPVQISALTGITAIAGGYYHTLALKNDGTVWSLGYNMYGQLGNGTTTDSNVPVQVSSLTGITAISGGGGGTPDGYSLALKNDGTVWTWGYNGYGELGNGNNTASNIPVAVSSLTSVESITGGWFHFLAQKNDGTVWASGYNFNGQLGNGNTTNSNVPVQVAGLCQVVMEIKESTKPLSVSIFPNPSNGIFQITNNELQITNLEIYNVLGEKVYASTKEYVANSKIDISNQPNGIYFVKIYVGEKIQIIKIIVE